MSEISSNQFPEMYEKLGIHIDELGCVMLDVDASEVQEYPNQEVFYTSPDEKKFWIKGFVAGKNPHVTLLFGLMKEGKEYAPYIKTVLADWKIESVKVASLGFFETPYGEEPYTCFVAHLEVTPELIEGRQRLQLLPHVDNFPDFKPHVTIGYIKQGFEDEVFTYYQFENKLVGKEFKVVGINLGEHE